LTQSYYVNFYFCGSFNISYYAKDKKKKIFKNADTI